ncbi:MAG TPA: hypothetical protein VGE07_31130 [Herpetosiphonaceae bacterium]
MYQSPPSMVRPSAVRLAWGAFWRMALRVFLLGLATGTAYGAVIGFFIDAGEALVAGGFFGGYFGAIAGFFCGVTSGVLVAAAAWWQGRRADWEPLRQRALLGLLSILPPLAAVGYVFWEESIFGATRDLDDLADLLVLPLGPIFIAALCCWFASGKIAAWASGALRRS